MKRQAVLLYRSGAFAFLFCFAANAAGFSAPAEQGFDREMNELETLIAERRAGSAPPDAAGAGNAQEETEEASDAGAPATAQEKSVYQPVVPAEPSPIPAEEPPLPPPAPGASAPWDPVSRELNRLDKEIKRRVKVTGRYRMAMGGGQHRHLTLTQADADLQDRDFHYLFGERQYNTFDPAIYNHLDLGLEADLTDKLSVYTRFVFDPWSYVGTTGDQDISEAGGLDRFNVNLKYFGANDSTVGEIYRAHFRNIASFPTVKTVDNKVPPLLITGVPDQGLVYRSTPLAIDHEFRPWSRGWVDYKEETWHTRVFAVAGEEQAFTTDDPMGLSNTKDFWQPSPWTARWVPIKVFADMNIPGVQGAVARGHYSDVEAFNAKTSYGEHLTLLRGVSLEADLGRAYAGGMIAAPWSPWEDYSDVNNLPGVLRLKHQVTPQWMVGGLYGFRVGLIDKEPDAYNQVISLDTKYAVTADTDLTAQIAGSRDDIDRLTAGNRRSEFGFRSDVEGMAYKGGLASEFDHPGGHSNYKFDFTWMDNDFRPHLSQYRALSDDNFWGKHITFHEYGPDLEYFRIGTGVDIGRFVFRNTLKTSMWDENLMSLFDARHVRSTDKTSFIENVMREELTYRIDPQWKAKGFTRWVILPRTVTDVEPFLNDFTFIDAYNLPEPELQNLAIDPGLDPSRFEIAGGLQYQPSERWTLEGSFTRTNDIPDFPRGLQNDVFLAAAYPDPDTPNVLIDKVQNFLYGQQFYDLPPYEFFSVFKEKVIWRPQNNMAWTFHAAQNGYKLWGPIDEMVNHQGVSLDYRYSDRLSFFTDYTHSYLADIPHLIDSGFSELNFHNHHNVYASMKYQVNPHAMLIFTYGVFGETVYDIEGHGSRYLNPFSVSEFSLPTVDTEHLFRVSLEGDF